MKLYRIEPPKHLRDFLSEAPLKADDIIKPGNPRSIALARKNAAPGTPIRSDRVQPLIDLIMNSRRSGVRLITGVIAHFDPQDELNARTLDILRTGTADQIKAAMGGGKKILRDTEGTEHKITEFEKTAEFGGGGGANAGSKDTATNEIAQAVVCAILIKHGDSAIDNITEDMILSVAGDIKTSPPIDDVMIQTIVAKIETDIAWKTSFTSTAKILKNEGYLTTDSKLFRGAGIPADIGAIFSAANKASKTANTKKTFDQINKWNPSDIWIANGAVTLPPTKKTSIDELNQWLLQRFHDKTLVGVSLKKTSTGNAHISIHNLDPIRNQIAAAIEELVVSSDHSIERLFNNKYTRVKMKESTLPLSLYFMLSEKAERNEVHYRQLNTGKDIAGQVQRDEAAEGNLNFDRINDLLKDITGESVTPRGAIYRRITDTKPDKFGITGRRQVILDIVKMALPFLHGNTDLSDANIQKKLFTTTHEYDDNSLIAKYQAVELLSILGKHRGPTADKFLQSFLLHTTSQSANSSVFIKVS